MRELDFSLSDLCAALIDSKRLASLPMAGGGICGIIGCCAHVQVRGIKNSGGNGGGGGRGEGVKKRCMFAQPCASTKKEMFSLSAIWLLSTPTWYVYGIYPLRGTARKAEDGCV